CVQRDDGCIYIEEPDRTGGVRVVTNEDVGVGDVVDVYGTVDTLTISGQPAERQIRGTVNLVPVPRAPVKPVGMTCKAVGGGPTPYSRGVVGGAGLNNIGLLVKIVGRVTDKISNYLWVDDGSGIQDTSDRIGVMVKCLFTPTVSKNDFVSCVGVVQGSVPAGWTANRRFICARFPEDITKF
ncbi:MAG: hypothetical protein N3B12_05415, partial [Armatimonadetes bacterium]|nr:hypothetical protein [Armatimonadota bacterium]